MRSAKGEQSGPERKRTEPVLGPGGGPLIAPSTTRQPAAWRSSAISSIVMGETALRSATTGARPVRLTVAAISPAWASARAGGTMLTTASLTATTSSTDPRRVSPSASCCVRPLRPATVVTTVAPAACEARPRALPIAPGHRIPIVLKVSTPRDSESECRRML